MAHLHGSLKMVEEENVTSLIDIAVLSPTCDASKSKNKYAFRWAGMTRPVETWAHIMVGNIHLHTSGGTHSSTQSWTQRAGRDWHSWTRGDGRGSPLTVSFLWVNPMDLAREGEENIHQLLEGDRVCRFILLHWLPPWAKPSELWCEQHFPLIKVVLLPLCACPSLRVVISNSAAH